MRTRWSESLVAEHILAAAHSMGGGLMPTANELRAMNRSSLAAVITRYGPKTYDGWAERLGLAARQHASRVGWKWERWFSEQASSRGLAVELRDRVKCPYDMLVSGLQVDVKAASHSWIANGSQWTWRIGKEEHGCAVYALIALAPDGGPPALFLVPQSEVPLTCTTHRRRYDQFKDNWAIFDTT